MAKGKNNKQQPASVPPQPAAVSQQSDSPKSIWQQLKERWDIVETTFKNVGLLFSTIDAVVAAGVSWWVPSLLTSSETLKKWMVLGVIIGGLVGYFRTSTHWKNVGIEKRKQMSQSWLLRLLVPIGLIALILLVIDVGFAKRWWLIEEFRELLLEADSFLLNAGMLILWALGASLLVNAITVLSPSMSKGS